MEKLEYRGFKEFHQENSSDITEKNLDYVLFHRKSGVLNALVYKHPQDKNTWCLTCDELDIHTESLCAVSSLSSWKTAIDLAILKLEKIAKEKYEAAISFKIDSESDKA